MFLLNTAQKCTPESCQVVSAKSYEHLDSSTARCYVKKDHIETLEGTEMELGSSRRGSTKYTSSSNRPRQINERRSTNLVADEITNQEGPAVAKDGAIETKRTKKATQWVLKEFSLDMLTQAPIGIVVLDPDTSIRYVNPALENLTGFTLAELIGRRYPFPWWTEERKRSIMRDAKRTGGFSRLLLRYIQRFEDIRLKKNGEQFWVEITSTPIMRGGKFLCLLSCWVDITERKFAEEELKKSRKELSSLSRHLQAAREDERRRVALQIHDELGQMLSALRMDLVWLSRRMGDKTSLLQRKTATAISLVELILQSIKRISAELRPVLLDDLGIAAAIEWQAQEFQKNTGIKCKASFSPEDIVFDHDLAIATYRIFQESLTNIMRHSGATKVSVRLIKHGDTVILKITDNGKGIAEEDARHPRGLGIIGMRERASSQGGRLTIKGIPGRGTTVEFAIRIDKGGVTHENTDC